MKKNKEFGMLAFGFVCLVIYVYMIWFMSWYSVPEANQESFADMRTCARDIVVLMAGFFFGSSRSSQRHAETIEKMVNEKSNTEAVPPQ
jgi:hypothetical protein